MIKLSHIFAIEMTTILDFKYLVCQYPDIDTLIEHTH